MRTCIGRIQRQTRRAFIEADGEPVPTSVILDMCYPTTGKRPSWHWGHMRRGARRFGVLVRKGWWQANPELMRLIKGED